MDREQLKLFNDEIELPFQKFNRLFNLFFEKTVSDTKIYNLKEGTVLIKEDGTFINVLNDGTEKVLHPNYLRIFANCWLQKELVIPENWMKEIRKNIKLMESNRLYPVRRARRKDKGQKRLQANKNIIE